MRVLVHLYIYVCVRASVSVCVCVFSPITQGRGKSFHFLDESLVSQKPRDLLLALCTASLFLSHSISIDFIHPIPRPLPSTPPLSLSFISFTPSSHFTFLSSCSTPTWRFPPPSPLNHTSISALHPSISHSLSLSLFFSLFRPPTPPLTHPSNHTSLLLQSQHFRSAVLCRHASALIYTFISWRNQFQSTSIAHTLTIL